MNLTALRTFLAIVETGSLVGASEQLHVTQSTVTARLKSLEDEIGQTLLARHKSGAVLTPAGQRLKRYAETISDLWRQARQETALPDGISSICNIASHPDLWPDLGQTLFDDLRRSQPTVGLSIWHGGRADLSNWIAAGLVDMCLTYWPVSQGNQKVYQLPGDRLRLVSTCPDSPVTFDPGYVFVEAGEAFGRDHAAAYADADIAKLSFGSATLGLEHVLKHGGSAYLPERIAAPYVARDQLHYLSDAPEFLRSAYLIVSHSIADRSDWVDKTVSDLTG